MIDRTSASLEWIEEASAKHRKADKILVEKVIRALLLLEGLSQSPLSYCFKGGTCAMLMMGSSRRMSIDIDIMASQTDGDLQRLLDEVAQNSGFLRCEPIHRSGVVAVPKEHYKFYYLSALSGKENFILLDVLREDIHYTKTMWLPVESDFLKSDGVPATAAVVPDFDNIIADKLTAFAPNTTGIPYVKKNSEMGMEIMIQN